MADCSEAGGWSRETLFNVLTAGNPQALEGSVWIDLFAGTGAVGIEALSRGAAMVYFVESSRRAAELIKQNLESLKIEGGFKILQQEAANAMKQLDGQGIRPNFIFLDPPYQNHKAYGQTLAALSGSALAADATVIAEHDKRFDPGEKVGGLQRSRRLEQGDAV